jgi:RNA polymerase sigma-70 factor (ECF subfamily)
MSNLETQKNFTASLNKQDREEIESNVDYKIHTYKGHIENKTAFRKTLKLNMERNYYRTKKARVNAYLKYMKEPVDTDNNDLYNEQLEMLDLSIEKLSYMKKWILEQYFKIGNLAEIARQNNMNENSVKSHYNLALKQLRKIMLYNSKKCRKYEQKKRKKEGPWKLLR